MNYHEKEYFFITHVWGDIYHKINLKLEKNEIKEINSILEKEETEFELCQERQ